MNSSEFCRDCHHFPICEEVEEDETDTEILDCSYKQEGIKMITKIMSYELNRHRVEMFKDDKAYAVVFKGKMFIRPTFKEVMIVYDDLIEKIKLLAEISV